MISAAVGSTEPLESGDKIYLDEPYASVRWVSSGRWVLIEWKAWANSSEYRSAYELALLALRENRASKNLVDAKRRRVVSDEDQRWLVENWIPRATAAGRRFTALVIPDSPLGKTIAENVQKRQLPTSTRVEYFPTVEDAAAWLSTVN
jgi:hypothetical protein